MSYRDRAASSAVGGTTNDAIQAMQGAALAHRRPAYGYYHLQYPAVVTNEAGWEIQCLADQAGWVTALLDDKQHTVVFATRQAAQDFLEQLHHESNLEYRVYPSFKG